MSDVPRRLQLQRHWAGAIAIAALCTQYSSLLMSQPQDKAHWNEKEVEELVNYLHDHRSEGEEGSFKDVTFNGVVSHIAPHLTQGPPKDKKKCKTKWASVCDKMIAGYVRLLITSAAKKALYCYRDLSVPDFGIALGQREGGWY